MCLAGAGEAIPRGRGIDKRADAMGSSVNTRGSAMRLQASTLQLEWGGEAGKQARTGTMAQSSRLARSGEAGVEVDNSSMHCFCCQR